MFRKVRTTPAHAVEICREYLRQNCLKKWTAHLSPATHASSHRQVLAAFGRLAALAADAFPQDWADRDYAAVKPEDWERMVADVARDFGDHADAATMEAHARRLVEEAVSATFTLEDDQDGQHASEDGIGAREDSEAPPRQRQRRAALIDNHPSSMNKRGRDWTSTEITGTGHRFEAGINASVSLTAASAKAFDDFALVVLVVKMFGSVVTVPADYNTPLAQVVAAAQSHKGNPLGAHRVLGGFRGVGAWSGLWDEVLWRKVKMEARSLEGEFWAGNPTCVVYHVEFVVLPEPVVID